jgi:SagB-type dehydrogenase family enzyme
MVSFVVVLQIILHQGAHYLFFFTQRCDNHRKMAILLMEAGRKFLKAHNWASTPDIVPDQRKGVPPPPFQKPFLKTAKLIDLVAPQDFDVPSIPLLEAINRRKSHRGYIDEPLSPEELSFLLWVTQGVHKVAIDNRHGRIETTKRTIPSGGSRHPYETYLAVFHVTGLQSGIYRYLALEHKLLFLSPAKPDLATQLGEICSNQKFVARAAVVFIWAVIPYRIEWRYSVAAHKGTAIEAGHICQNLYLACEAIGAGTCAIAAYDQDALDELLALDGTDEFVVYLSPVGKIPQQSRYAP